MAKIYCTVGGTDVTLKMESGSMTVYDRTPTNASTAMFNLNNPDTEPLEGNAVAIYVDDTTQTLFGGVIASISRVYIAPRVVGYRVACIGYWRLFNRRLVKRNYNSDVIGFATTSNAVISDIIDNFTDTTLGFTMTNVVYNSPQMDILFNYRKPTDCLREIAEPYDAEWYIDENKDVHYFVAGSAGVAPLNFTDATLLANFESFSINSDYTQIRNRVFVQGGYTESSSPETVTLKGTGSQKIWNLPYRPHDISITVGGVGKSIGQENIDTDDGTYNFMYNYYEQTLFCGASEAAPGDGVSIAITYNFEYPIIVQADDTVSQSDIASAEGGDGIYEYVLKDNTLTWKLMCEARASRELKKWSKPRIDGTATIVDYYGFKAGQTIVLGINEPDGSAYRYNGTYFIKQVLIEDIGNNILRYTINFEGENYGN